MKYVSVSDLQIGDVFMEDTSPEVYEVRGYCQRTPGAILASDVRSKEEVTFLGNVCLILLGRTSPDCPVL